MRAAWVAIAFIAFALVAAAALRIGTAPGPPAPPRPPNGIAIAYAAGPFVRYFRLAGTLTLDRSPKNRSWYCDWLMLVAVRKPSRAQPMVQAGLMRWSRNGYRLSAFFARGYGDARPIAYEDLAPLSEGAHRVALVATHANLAVLVDGRVLRRIDLRDVFRSSDVVYAQLAGEVYEPGDSIRATVDNAVLARDGEPSARPYADDCRRHDRGLRMQGPDDRLLATGTFDLALGSGQTGCRHFFGFARSRRAQ
jgi:hypothetical protein